MLFTQHLISFIHIITCYNRRFLSVQQHSINSMRDGPMGHGFGCGDGSCIVTGIRGMSFVYSLLSVLWLSSLWGARFSLGPVRALFVLVFSFCFEGSIQKGLRQQTIKRKRPQPVSWALFWLFSQTQGVHLLLIYHLRFCFVFSFKTLRLCSPDPL